MKFSIKNFFSKCDQIHRKLRISSDLLKKSLMENFTFCAVSFLMSSSFNPYQANVILIKVNNTISFMTDD